MPSTSHIIKKNSSLSLYERRSGLGIRIFLLALLAAGLAPAQDQLDPGSRGQLEPTYEVPSTLSGPNGFGTYARSTGAYEFTGAASPEMPMLPDAADRQEPRYAGPTVLSRENSLATQMKGPKNVFGLYADIIGIYDSGLIAPSSTLIKPVSAVGSAGQETDFGVIASHRWRRGELSIDYRGSYREYTNAPAFGGLDQLLQVDYHQALGRHLALNINTALGTTTLTNGAFSYFPAAATIESIGIPADELFNTRTNYLQSRVELRWLLSPRVSVSFGGDGFVVRRESLLLAGLNGYTARTSAAYRLTPRQTISASYNHMYFDFERAFGNSSLETGALGYSIVLSRQWELAALMGGVRVNTLGLTRVTLDPAVAALLGQSFAVVTFSGTHYLPVTEARLTGRFKQASLLFDYSNSITPGNGFYLTSRQTAGSVSYSYVAARAFQARMSMGYNEFSALGEIPGQGVGKYSNLQSGVQLLYKLGDIFFNLRYDYRHYTTGDAFLRLDSNRVSAGVAFNFGEVSPFGW